MRLYDYIRSPANNYLVFEYCAGGDLRAWLRERPGGRVNELTAQAVMRQVGEALRYLYQNNVIHRDLKLQNILLSEKHSDHSVSPSVIKIADFGLAR